ncbi:MAG TPA: type II toxin-antitoxin system RelE/ParE family toxin [Bacteroidales bacterium]|nr:MAG: plasmid stabilization protein [Bacteroidetes bacterium GWF2_33_38]OFY72882.1 MAG: plasmid stabilization protein [Bacteroidetes bacterium RIFOXYA12_FULL_33_9]OFY92262.1 MAG: plasmid stabilization protein [Bacteroidetes bacterium RIFOXYA2_FULL_33_7]HBF87323.1 type II toxin-antitoxin system RelE/ParE family toxin [Bacteroidales bacterium]
MSKKIVLSKRAARNLENLLEYLETKWSKRIKDNFIKKLDRTLNIIKDRPESSTKSEIIKGLYRNVITKQTTVYYKFDSEKLYIVTIFDTRQNLSILKKEAEL